jgi:hypothetical protein
VEAFLFCEVSKTKTASKQTGLPVDRQILCGPPFRFMLIHHSGDVDPPVYQKINFILISEVSVIPAC